MIQLKIRSEYSFGKVFAPIDRIIQRLKELGCTDAGIVDIDGTWGHYQWQEKLVKEGIRPLFGVDLIVTSVEEELPRMWFIAKNDAGLKELYNFTTLAHHQPIKTKFGSTPRLSQTDVLLMSDNVYKFAGDIVDADFLQRCGAILDLSPTSRILNRAKEYIARDRGLSTVKVSDNSYVFEDDKKIYEMLTSSSLKPTPQHIIELKDQGREELIAAVCAGVTTRKAPMVRAEGDLEALCRAGIEKRRLTWNDTYEARLNRELTLIREKDFDSYFIVVADMVKYAKQHMLVGPSRGSAAGSLVCYLSGITEIDPLIHNLFFERFIDVSRSDLPDIDLDFPDTKRGMVLEYMAEKYGKENVSQIGTISRYKPKSALIQVCKKLDIPPQATSAVKIAMIERSSADARANNCLLDTLEGTTPGRELLEHYPQVKAATFIEGHASHTGTHAAGLLVCNEKISDFCTIDGNGIAQIEKGPAEAVGLLKIDILGLRTLGILEDSGVDVDWYHLPFDDPKVYETFNAQRMCSIFQFDGNAMRDVSKQMTFHCLADIDAATALARPGPFAGGVTRQWLERRLGAPYEPIHPLVQEQMNETYGLPVYQEQTLAIVREIGKFDWKETSIIRKAMSKSMGKEFFDKYWEKFKEGAASQGIPENAAATTWNMINSMGSWAMNKAHTRSYAVISYWCAWLKTHHPLEFAAANLRHAKDDESAIELLREMVAEGIEYVPFDPYLSEANWCVKDGKLIAGVSSLHGFGDIKAAKFIEKRNAGKLTKEEIEDAKNKKSVFSDIFPIRTKYGHLYDDPKRLGVVGKIVEIGTIDGSENGSFVFIGELAHKNPRNSNEDHYVKKRGGKRLSEPTDFLDIRVKDDTGDIICRIDRFKYKSIGVQLFEDIPIGAHLLIRANISNNIRFAWLSKWRRLDDVGEGYLSAPEERDQAAG